MLYINKEWDPLWGGDLELWEGDRISCVKTVTPLFNRCVLFDTNNSFHGHPDPLKCPDHTSRKSLALYYFTDTGKHVKTKSTRYMPKRTDPWWHHVLSFGDRQLIKAYSLLKRYTGLKDDTVSNVLKKLHK